jgi:signal transduction histidine kinase
VRVSDSGVGISEADLPRIFEPFFTSKPAGEGNGLGLMVAHGIVKDHGGGICVESEVGRGTEFRIEFPPPDAAR